MPRVIIYWPNSSKWQNRTDLQSLIIHTRSRTNSSSSEVCRCANLKIESNMQTHRTKVSRSSKDIITSWVRSNWWESIGLSLRWITCRRYASQKTTLRLIPRGTHHLISLVQTLNLNSRIKCKSILTPQRRACRTMNNYSKIALVIVRTPSSGQEWAPIANWNRC